MNDWSVLILVYLTLFIGSPLIILLHELGHAFAYLWLTRPESIDIYVGSYGDKANSFDFKQGRINVYIRRTWRIFKGLGMCVSSKVETDYRKHIIILLAGVFFTLFIALIPSAIVFYTHANLNTQIVCYVFLGLSRLSLLANLLPMNYNGGVRSFGVERPGLESDGRQIIFAIRARKVYHEYASALQSVRNKDSKSAIENLKTVNNAVPKTQKVLRYLYVACLQAQRYDEAQDYLEQLAGLGELQLNDLINKGCLYTYTDRHDEAIAMYQKVLKKNRDNVYALNNLGYEMIKKGAHKVAAQLFDKALKLRPGFEMAICNSAYSKILQGELAEGKDIIDRILASRPDSAEAYFYLAIYYLKLNKRDLAEASLAKAKELDSTLLTGDYEEELEKLSESVQL